MRIVVALFVTTVLLGGAVPPAWAADAAPRVPVDGQRVFVMGHSSSASSR
ncbi:MAG: hypothetical protein ACKOHK_15010 [Planctomycetia bacterium]